MRFSLNTIFTLAAATWLAWSQAAVGSVVVVSFISDTNTQGFTPSGLPTPNQLDFDNNGQADVLFTASQSSGFRADSANASELLVINSTPPNLGSFSIPLNPGDIIGPATMSPVIWKNESFGAIMADCTLLNNDFVCLGLWPWGIHYLGLRFDVGGSWRYGWVEIDSWTGLDTGYIRSYGWETDANTPIAAGAPEPARAALLLIGLISMHCRRRRALGSG